MLSYVEVAKHQYIDVKVQKLKIGTNTANGLWHLDGSLNPLDEYENYLFVSGKARTEFITNVIEVPHVQSSVEFNRVINSQILEKVAIPDNTIVKFNGSNVHRGVEVKEDETRLLVRLINTNKKLPYYKR